MSASSQPVIAEPLRARPRKRLPPSDRKRQIVQAAVTYFASVGFDGGTRELARQLEVTQPLIYRYFPSKNDLIQAVYQEVYLARWQPNWELDLDDVSIPIRDRLITFYERFAAVVFTPEWIRIYLFSGLRGLEMNQWWITFVEDHLLRRMAGAVRQAHGLPSLAEKPVVPEELELYWLFHGGIFYYGQRREVYGYQSEVGLSRFIATSVDALLDGLPTTLARLLATTVPAATAADRRRAVVTPSRSAP